MENLANSGKLPILHEKLTQMVEVRLSAKEKLKQKLRDDWRD
jgi:hypothetical protein